MKRNVATLAVAACLVVASLIEAKQNDLPPGLKGFRQNAKYIPLKFDLQTGSKSDIQTDNSGPVQAAQVQASLQAAVAVPGVSGVEQGFVGVNGTQFVLNGRPFYAVGTNAYYAALVDIMSDQEVVRMFQKHSSEGVNLIRVFAFSNFDSVATPMMPNFGSYNEAAIKRLDLVLKTAAQYNVKLILTLSNYWDFLGGMQDYVDKTLGLNQATTPPSQYDIAEFYRNTQVKNNFKAWISKIVQRQNTLISQSYYINDPTIFAWELANEPRARGFDATIGLKTGQTLCNWVWEISRYIKTLDPNHIVLVGDEGMRSDGSPIEPHSYLNRGYEGVDWTCNLKSPAISAGTLHLYPSSWGFDASTDPNTRYSWLGDNYIKDRAILANQLQKPILLEEYGMPYQWQGLSRNTLFDYEQNEANKANYGASLVWAVSHYSAEATTNDNLFGSNDGQGFVFGYSDETTNSDGSRSLTDQYTYMNQKTSALASVTPKCNNFLPIPTAPPGCQDIPPDTSFTCAQQASFGKCTADFIQSKCLCQISCNTCATCGATPK